MMFRDAKKDSATADPLVDRLPAPPSEKPAAASFLGQTVRLQGKMAGEDDVTIEGRFKGEIELKRNLLVGIEGYIEADIHAANVTVAGHVTGSVTADARVKILDSGVMDGTLNSPKIIIADGGQLRGHVNTAER